MSRVLGPNIARLRQAREMKQTTLARRLGIPVSSLSNYELGPNRVPEELVPRIANELGATICELYGIEEGHTEGAPGQSIADRVAARLIEGWEELPPAERTFLQEMAEATERFRSRLLAEEGLSGTTGREIGAQS